MLFKFAWTHSPAARDATIKKFMETGLGQKNMRLH